MTPDDEQRELLDILDGLGRQPSKLASDVIQRHQPALLAHGAVIDGHGVTLEPGLERLAEQAVRDRLDYVGQAWLRGMRIDRVHASTNTTMVSWARERDVDGQVLTTELQSAGRGRRGRSWTSLYACNLAVSLGSTFDRVEATQGFSLVVGIAVVLALQDVGAEGAALKWPNDVWWRDRKVSGILVEAVPAHDAVQVIAGIGINVRLPAAARAGIDQPVADAADLAGQPVSRNALLAALINRYAACAAQFREAGLTPFAEAWRELDALANRRVVASGAESFDGVARGINAAGELLIESGGELHPVRSGEVSVRPEEPDLT